MSRARTAALVLLGAGAGGMVQAGCGASLPATQRMLAEGSGLQVAFAPRPAPLALGRHVALDIVVCAPAGEPLPATLAVDADMPAHRHGMNYRATVTTLGDGRFRAEGLMFHMAGRWRILFDLPGPAGTPNRRISHDLELR
jgi:YtkA-like